MVINPQTKKSELIDSLQVGGGSEQVRCMMGKAHFTLTRCVRASCGLVHKLRSRLLSCCGVEYRYSAATHTHTHARQQPLTAPLPSQRCVLTWEDLGVDQVLGTQWVAAAVNCLQPETVVSCSVFTTSLNEALNNIVATPRGANKSLANC